MDLLFALYDSDVFYATRFMEYFKKKKEFGINVVVFTRKESLLDFLKANILEILLIHEELSIEEIPMERVRHVYKLSESDGSKEPSNNPAVFKYQNAQIVMKEIMHDYLVKMNTEKVANQSKQVRLITIYPIRPEVEAIAYTLALSAILAEQRKVLLVVLDPLPVPIFTDLYNQDNNLSEFVYYLKGNSDIQSKLKSLIIVREHLSILSGISHGLDILSIDKEDIQKWTEELRISYDYQTVIFYLGGYTEAGIELLKLSDIITIPIKNYPYQKVLYQELFNQMITAGIDTRNDRFIQILLPDELNLGQNPVGIQELAATKAWNTVLQHINTYL